MQKTNTQLPEIKLVGITARTSNALEITKDPQISTTVQRFFHDGLSAKIPHRTNPNTTYCVYTEYESDFNGEYTYHLY